MARARGVARAPIAPRHPRRVSGPVAPARPTPVPGRPRPSTPVTASHSAVGAGLRALPDHRLLDGLLRSRAWIWLLGIALGGIVFMQVSLLQMNNGIGNNVSRSTELQHSNAMLEGELARLSGGERIAAAAAAAGLVDPDAATVGFLDARPGIDADRAARAMIAPSDTAIGADEAPAPTETVAPEVATVTPTGVTPETAPVEPVATAAPVDVAPVEPVATAVTPTETATDPTVAAAAPPDEYAAATGAATAP